MNPSNGDDKNKALLKSALVALDELQAKVDGLQRGRHMPIAIVGMGCRFPGGANNPEAYWQLLVNGVDAVRELPPDRWRKHDGADAGLPADDPRDGQGARAVSWYGGYLDDIDQFDPHFFGISPREAASMDPQQRLVLEVGWEALESAGLAPDGLMGSQTGVFLGITTNDYGALLRQGPPGTMDAYAATGGALNAAAGRLAFTLGLQGPTLAVDTACSSSLVAVHLACQSLRNGECSMALAGGVNVMLTPEAFVAFAAWGMMAPDGRCKTFDADADGFVRGEGCGMVVLKRLDDAVAAGDRILALMRGSAVNQDGRSSGLTVPNGPAQQAVIRRALAEARVRGGDIGYVEAHGTGTALGDPIEVEALGAVLGEGRPADRPLVIGSVKTNLGHLESAAGVAGLIKLVLSLEHETIPPHLHFRARSPRIPWPAFAVEIPTEAEEVATCGGHGGRLAGISGFGFSGTNAHLVIEEAPAAQGAAVGAPGHLRGAVPHEGERPLQIAVLSAPNAGGLAALAARHAQHLAEHPELPPADVAFTLNTGRAQFAQRLAVVAAGTEEMEERLRSYAAGERCDGVHSGSALVGSGAAAGGCGSGSCLPGRGRSMWGWGASCMARSRCFGRRWTPCAALFDAQREEDRPVPLLRVLFGDADGAGRTGLASLGEGEGGLIDETAYTQPALFALEYALAQLWQGWGVRPSVVIGHSIGEYAAACLAGVFSLEDAVRLVAARGRLMGALPHDGEMMAVGAEEAQVRAALAPFAAEVAIAAVNGPASVVIAGRRAAVLAIGDEMAAAGVKTQRLKVSHAFHSPLMEPMLRAFGAVAATVTYHKPSLRLISNVTGKLAGEEVTRPEYWVRHVREAVRFADGVRTVYEQGVGALVEIGPKPVLLGMAGQVEAGGSGPRQSPPAMLPSLRQGLGEWQQLLESLGELYVRGVEVDWPDV